MNCKKLYAGLFVGALGLAGAVGSYAFAQNAKDAKAAEQPQVQLPPGWTEADMKAAMLASMPGKMQEHLVKGAGVWEGKSTMWMGPDAPAMKSDVTSTATALHDGRHLKVDIVGEMPGMGAYKGMGLYGYDNTAQQFVSTWLDNQSTGLMQGVGELSPDGKTLTWKYTYHCPINKKPATIREVETITGENTRRLEMFGAEPKSGKEFKMMSVEFTKKP